MLKGGHLSFLNNRALKSLIPFAAINAINKGFLYKLLLVRDRNAVFFM